MMSLRLFEVKKFWRIAQFNKCPLLSGFTQFRYSFNDKMIGLEKFIKNKLEVVVSVDTCYYFTYQAVKSKKPCFIQLYENIPFNWGFKKFSV